MHLGIPYKGDIGNTMLTRTEWNAKVFIPRFKGESPNGPWITFLKLVTSGSQARSEKTFTWKLRTGRLDGLLYLEGDTDAPFRATGPAFRQSCGAEGGREAMG